ncbi:hypothetical protein LSAT2_008399 [Lamellibrachia satsuma]|nr:hypothetical protein LSAT2_008399 [Lamellibrachia satsuma]
MAFFRKTQAKWGERNCPSFETAAGGIEPRQKVDTTDSQALAPPSHRTPKCGTFDGLLPGGYRDAFIMLMELGDSQGSILLHDAISTLVAPFRERMREEMHHPGFEVHIGWHGGKNDVIRHIERDCHRTKASALSRIR